jgi:hypothetical protein
MSKFKTIMGVNWENEIVPDFDSYGRPDLLKWDNDMDNDIPEFEKWATFYDEEAADACRPVLKELQEQQAKDYDPSDPDYDRDYPPEFEEKKQNLEPSWEWFWKDWIQADLGFECHSYGWGKMEDDLGKPYPMSKKYPGEYDWDYICSTAPSRENFVATVTEEVKSQIFQVFEDGFDLENLFEEIENAHELYKKHYKY